ncbi:hypothetical protein Bca52824_014255 [Brassica carinata]|uniref:Proteasome subunit beta type-3 n=1 Tax=Brassica carinata TaxID=52824 RepID=A0A8X8B4M5_BRACI|nr:hypothetical protein Bca52824_014255 [Brassica carinata]
MSIFEYNGSAVVAMVGKNCFAIASDRRLGVQLQTIATDFQRISKIHDRVFIGLSGLATDVQTLYQRLVFRHKLYQLREERDMKPETFASLVSAILYEKRFGPYLCQPVIAGLGEDDKPFICTMDSIGAKELAKDFVVSGTASESLYGACEAMYKPDMEAEELFETISQALLSSVDRDCLSGWGGHVYVVYCCTFFSYDMLHTKRIRRRRNHMYTESDADDNDGSFRYYRSRREVEKEERLRKPLRPRSHRERQSSSHSGLSQYAGGVGLVHGIRVSRESKFARKGSKRRVGVHHGPHRAYQRLVFRHKLYQLREERDMKPETFASLVSAILYEKRFGPYLCQPVIAGLGEDDKPFICTMDSIGAKELAKDFVVSGTASESLYGACEAMYKPDMEAEELFETISQALLSSVDRDCLSGWEAMSTLCKTPTEIKERILKGRMD